MVNIFFLLTFLSSVLNFLYFRLFQRRIFISIQLWGAGVVQIKNIHEGMREQPWVKNWYWEFTEYSKENIDIASFNKEPWSCLWRYKVLRNWELNIQSKHKRTNINNVLDYLCVGYRSAACNMHDFYCLILMIQNFLSCCINIVHCFLFQANIPRRKKPDTQCPQGSNWLNL